ncbi:UDP-N-acetylglucosamine diphosphorylase [Termitidicoccus mucosus]|uniref:UDP-N-acetylglucosamine diphosphorylase n=1 Tax=Termitidicoccus mucosus TaxID=1184151 RepID=A0A178IDL8_9BACT|nr:UDP-N-acetylglucosamine diphosphorylase [Opitutaceae bacterium TSB47]
MHAADLFAFPPSLSLFAAHFPADAAPWEWVRAIAPALKALPPPATGSGVAALSPQPSAFPPGVHVEGDVRLAPGVRLPAHATLIGPAWIGPGTEIRPGAFIRGHVITGANCVLGNSCEFKNCLLLDGVQVPHFSYVGDSVLGNRAHLGAGVILSNLRLDQQPVSVRLPDGSLAATGLRKLGALVADAAEVGCNAVLQPGAILGRRALVMPLTAFGGCLPPDTIARSRASISTLPRRGS